MERFFLLCCFTYLRLAPEPLRLLELEPLLELLRLDELLVPAERLLLELLLVLLEPAPRVVPLLLPLERLGRLTLLSLVVGRVEVPLLLELGRLTPLLPVRPLEPLLFGRPTPLLLLELPGRLTLPLELPFDGVLPPLGFTEPPLLGVGAGGLLFPLWLLPELMLPPSVFGLTVALGAAPPLLGAGGVTS